MDLVKNAGANEPGNAERLKEIVKRVYELISRQYPDASSRLLEPSRGNPVDVLVATILSQATNDTLSERAFRELKRTFPTWEKVLEAHPLTVERALSYGGLQREKTKKIISALEKIRQDFGEITLAPLQDLTKEEAYEYLLSLPGVGPKTAACVLVFGLGKPAFPVDTHILRISRRLGLVPERSGAGKAQAVLEEVVPDEIKLPLHVMLIQHGRETCHSRKPRCRECSLREICSSLPGEGVTRERKN